jgi:hypothetical protein
MTSATGVPQALTGANYKPLTCINSVSEGGLEPPCPFGALAPQASASAYSATRTSACHGWCRASRITIANPGGYGDAALGGRLT